MATSNSSISGALLDPFTPTAFLSPELGYQVTVSTYLCVGSLSVMIWEILSHLRSDYILLFKYPLRLPTFIYFISRLGSLAFVLSATIFNTASIGHCAKVELISCLMHALAISSTALLFFFRVRAIFDRNKLVVAFFALLWVIVVAGTLAVIPGVAGANIGPTNYCMLIKSEPYVATAVVIPLVNDTLVFLAISWRLMECAHAEMSVRTGLRILAFGDHLLPLSKALLQDGQMYYLTTVTAGIMTVIMHFVHVVPAAYKTMFTIPNVAVMSMMAGRVFRNTKFGHFKQSSISTSSILFSLGDQKNRNAPLRSAAIPPTGTVQFTDWEETSRNTQSLEIPVEVTVQSEHWRKESDGKYVDQKLGYSEVV